VAWNWRNKFAKSAMIFSLISQAITIEERSVACPVVTGRSQRAPQGKESGRSITSVWKYLTKV